MNQKSVTKKYFNEQAASWRDRVYDLSNLRIKFPNARVRQEIAIEEIARRYKRASVLDMGCGGGELVTDLLKRGYNAEGFDIAPAMVEEAKKLLAKEKKTTNINLMSDEIFCACDLADFKSQKKYDFITAMGFVEYLDDDKEFFVKANGLLKNKGLAIVEFRNDFFNLFTANEYTKTLLRSKNKASLLLKEFNYAEKFSPLKFSDVPRLEKAVAARINEEIQSLGSKDLISLKSGYKPIPKSLRRRQYTPGAVEIKAKEFGFKLQYVIYYHAHPFLPAYEKYFPILFNTIGLAMQPLGYTPIGASICSSFLAVMQKSIK